MTTDITKCYSEISVDKLNVRKDEKSKSENADNNYKQESMNRVRQAQKKGRIDHYCEKKGRSLGSLENINGHGATKKSNSIAAKV